MIEVTLDKNLVPCERPTFPVLHPLVDLTADLPAARTVIAAATRFFWLSSKATYSGVARKLDEFDGQPGPYGPCYYVQLWQGNQLLRTVAFRDLGYVGLLNIHLQEDQAPANDLIGDLCNGAPQLPEGYASQCIGYVGDGRVEIALPYVAAF